MKNIKKLMERRDELQASMAALVSTADTEERAMSDEEAATFDAAEKEIRAIDDTIAREERARSFERTVPAAGNDSTEQVEERAFEDYVMGRVTELRTGEQNMTLGNNGAVIPTTIANRIIKAIKDRCPIFAGATIYNVKGNLKIPVWGKAGTHDIAVGYATEFAELTADAGKFTSVDLSGYLVGALVLVGRSLETNSQFNITDFIVNQMADEISTWIEKECLTGSGTSAMQGAINTTNTVTAAAVSAITADELIELQCKVKQAYQANACWTMAPATFLSLKKLKDSNGRYLLQDNITGSFPYMILGKPVYLSDNMPAMKASAKTILYGDYSGLAVNIHEGVSIEILREKYATQHAIGVDAWMELDSKIVDNQKLAVLVQAAS